MSENKSPLRYSLHRHHTSNLRVLWVLAGILWLLLGGCETEQSEQSLALSTPPSLLQNHAIDPASLTVTVVVNGQPLIMRQQGDKWTGSFSVSKGEMANIVLTWLENTGDGSDALPLALYAKTIGPVNNVVSLELNPDSYDSDAFDDDQDGFSNFEERRDGSDPRDAANPGTVSVNVYIPRLPAPVIDGNYDVTNWNNAASVDRNNKQLKIDNLLLGDDDKRSNGDTEYEWVAMHDGVYLYVFVFGEVAEGATVFADSDNAWRDDSVELFLDGNNSKGDSYDGVDDFYYMFPLLVRGMPFQANSSESSARRVYQGPNSIPLPVDFTFATCMCSDVHTWEFRINLEQAGIAVDQPFGIELHLNDDQDGDGRDAKWAWKLPMVRPGNGVAEDDTSKKPRLMGTARLMP